MLCYSFIQGQNLNSIKQIDSIATAINLTASHGLMDTLKVGLLRSGGTTYDVFILKLNSVLQKITVINNSNKDEETIVFKNGIPVLASLSYHVNKPKLVLYINGNETYQKNGNRYEKVDNSFRRFLDGYISLSDRTFDL